MQTAIQLFTIRDMDEPLPEIVRLVADAGYDGIELAGLPGSEGEPTERTEAEAVAELVTALDEHDVSVAGVHLDHRRLDDDTETVVGHLDSLDCDSAVVPYLDDSYFASEEAVESTAEYLAELADRLAEDDVRLLYHNHAHEFVDLDGETAFDSLIRETPSNVLYELDVGWADAGGHDPVELLEILDNRCPLVHIKDVAVADDADYVPAELGEGEVALEACVDAAANVGTEWFVYEHDEPENPVESLALGAERLNALSTG
ncbi:MAG TPA: sugar phosphate isomerase/epimerase [Halococcus sp.]|nr:sugar phosphate isomerase/epimerase [Halococcus sp.]